MKDYMIKVENLQHSYSGRQDTALKGVSLEIFQGEFVAIVGQNGSGKTTLVKHFNGLLKPTEGIVRVAGMDTSKVNVSQLAQKVGYVFQNPDHQIFHKTVRKEVSFGPKNLGVAGDELTRRVDEALQEVNLLDYKEADPYSLSKGQRQRVALASVLAMKTKIIILDEPTTGQDYREGRQIMCILQKLHQEGHTIIFITHDMSLVAEYAERVIVMLEGKVLADGQVRKVFSSPAVFEQAGLEQPPITTLAQMLADYNCPSSILTVREMAQWIKSNGGNNYGCSGVYRQRVVCS